MATPHEKLADSLDILRRLQERGRRVFQSSEFSRTHRTRLIKNGFIQEIMKGWVMSADPGQQVGETTTWYASFWEFCSHYCQERFGDQWHLSPEQSLLWHSGHTIIPTQLIVCSPKGTNNTIELLFGTSIYDLKQAEMPPREDLEEQSHLRLFTIPAAITKVSESFFKRHATEAQLLLSMTRDATELLRYLLAGGHSTVAGRLAGAFRRLGREDLAEEIAATMKAADYVIRETDPFESERSFATISTTQASIVGRLRALWGTHRQMVIEIFPSVPGLPRSRKNYLKTVDEVYRNDAYHSLSIEGYRVSAELIERVRHGAWNPRDLQDDWEQKNALAARGYWQAFQEVKSDVAKVITGEDPGKLVGSSHRSWYRELFQPCVAAGLVGAEMLAGYRNNPVYIKNSLHIPPRAEVIRDAMPTFFQLLSEEKEASVRAVLGHWLFGYLHPYPDGNGRIARFLMNVMLASGGYPWTVVRVDKRDEYMTALENASAKDNVEPFARFLAGEVQQHRLSRG